MNKIKKFDYNGSPIQFEVIDGKVMANATLMAIAFKKDPFTIFRTKAWKEYENAVIEEKRINSADLRTSKNGSPENGGGSWIHEELVIEFARRLNPRFSIWCNDKIAELLRTGKTELVTKTDWDIKRYIAKTNYRLQTDAVKENIITMRNISKDKEQYVYIEEAEVINKSVFGTTSREWKRGNPDKAKGQKNMRDYADIHQLIVLANMESFNAILINKNIPQPQRLHQLIAAAQKELEVFYKHLKAS